MTALSDLRAEAEALARQLPKLNVKAEASEAEHVGSAGRRRAGTGEHFWQYRRYATEDASDRIDWRRSARGNDLYVRETELETARTFLFWCDGHPGFNWRGPEDSRTKADEARLIMLALGILLSKDGERIGSLGTPRKSSFGKRAVDRLAEDLSVGTGADFPTPPKRPATLIIASDFYDPLTEWQARLKPLAAHCPEGILLAVASPIEIDFPFEGRIKLSRPGTVLDRIVGRAETMREEYQEKYVRQRRGLKKLAARMGWYFVDHNTGRSSLEGAADVKRSLESFGATP